jgi:hypothetical protein
VRARASSFLEPAVINLDRSAKSRDLCHILCLTAFSHRGQTAAGRGPGHTRACIPARYEDTKETGRGGEYLDGDCKAGHRNLVELGTASAAGIWREQGKESESIDHS